MAIASIPLNLALVVKYQVGTTAAGAPILRQKTLNGVKFDAETQDIYDVAMALFDLVDYPVIQVILRRNDELSSDG